MIPDWLTSPEWTNVVTALLHTLWQGMLCAVLLGLMLRRLTHPLVRYRCALGALVGVVAAGLVTWGILCRPLPGVPLPAPPPLTTVTIPATRAAHDSATLIVRVRPLAPKAADVRWSTWLALFWVMGTTLMLGRAAFQVAGAERLRRSSRPLDDARVVALLAEARQAVGLMRHVRLAVTGQLTSPVVAGVLVPTLILPLSLISSLAPEQIRFILLHELAHIRRGDYFANLFQLFAEALLFFNPAVWWISRQMRLEREACCDALAVELSGAPADYARTLVHVVENALSPAPAAAPALGDRREPSSLTDRLQRMLVPGYRPSLRLTWRAMFVALLTGGGLLFLTAIGTRETIAAIPGPAPVVGAQTERPAQVLIEAEIYQVSPENLQNAVPGLAMHAGQTRADNWWLVSPPQFAQLRKSVKKAGLNLITRPRIQTNSGKEAQFFVGNDDGGTELDCLPTVDDGQVQLHILGKISDQRSSSPRTNSFTTDALLQNHGGMVFSLQAVNGTGGSNFMVTVEVEIVTNTMRGHSDSHAGIEGNTNFQTALQAVEQRTGTNTLNEPETTTLIARGENLARLYPNLPPLDRDWTNGPRNSVGSRGQIATTFRLNKHKSEMEIEKLLVDAGVKVPPTTFLCGNNGLLVVHGTPDQLALVYELVLKLNGHSDHEIAASKDSFARHLANVVAVDSTNLVMRTFQVDPREFQAFLNQHGGPETNEVEQLQNVLNQLGLDLGPNTGKAIFLNDRGYLFVKATASDLETIEQVLATIPTNLQIHLKARFIEVPKGTFQSFNSLAAGQMTGILTDANMRTILRTLAAQHGTETLGEPEVTLLNGRQVQMRATTVLTVVTNLAADEDGKIIPETGSFETGPVLNAVPRVLADGYTINLDVAPSLTEFEGYADPEKMETNHASNSAIPKVFPIFRTQKLKANINLWDNQTVVLGGMEGGSTYPAAPTDAFGPLSGQRSRPKMTQSDKEILVLITATIVDAAGSRVHTDEDLPFAQNGVPTQPATANSSVSTTYAQPGTASVKLEDGGTKHLTPALSPFGPSAPAKRGEGDTLPASGQNHALLNSEVQPANPSGKFPSQANSANDVIWTGPGRQAIVAKMKHIQLQSINWDGRPLTEVLKQLSAQCKALDPEHKGVNFLINNNPDLSGPGNATPAGSAPAYDPQTGLALATTGTESTPEVGSYIIKIPSLTDVSVADVLDAIVMVSDHPLKYSILDFAIVFSPRGAERPQLFTETFLVDPNTFDSGLAGVGSRSFGVNQNNNGGNVPVVGVVNTFSGQGAVRSSGNGGGNSSGGAPTPQSLGTMATPTAHGSAAEVAARARVYFTSLGVNFLNPSGKTIFYNDRRGVLAIKASKEDLEIIKRALQKTNAAPVDSRY